MTPWGKREREREDGSIEIYAFRRTDRHLRQIDTDKTIQAKNYKNKKAKDKKHLRQQTGKTKRI